MKRSAGELFLETRLKQFNVPFVEEFKFHPDRKWRADFALSGTNILVEVEGGTWSYGRHSRGSGMAKDMEKYNEAAAMGYIVLRYTTDQVMSDYAIKHILAVVGKREDGVTVFPPMWADGAKLNNYVKPKPKGKRAEP